MANNKWSELTVGQKRVICVAGAAEIAVTAAALRDLARRPASQVRGPKAAWVVAFFIQPLGPLAYFAAGKR